MIAGAWLLPLVVFVLAYALLRLLLARATAWLPRDIPNARSMHAAPTPRFGGLAILLGMAAGLAAMSAEAHWWAPLALLVSVSWFDDYRPLPALPRLIVHFVAAAIFLALMPDGAPAFWLAALLTLGMVWMTNLYNFMDGLDGLAGGMAVFGFAAYALAAQLAGAHDLMLAALCIAAAAAAFLVFNLPPARLFLGDAGAIPLGFFAAALGIEGWRREVWSALFPLVVFSPFIADASLTLLRRAWQGKPIGHAHREHYYQRLARLGWPVQNVVLAAYALMLLATLAALLGERYAAAGWALSALTGMYLAAFRWIDRRWLAYAAKS